MYNKYYLFSTLIAHTLFADAGAKIFVWLGKELEEKLPDESVIGKVASAYLKQDKSGRQLESEHVIHVKQGAESADFKSYFKSWN